MLVFSSPAASVRMEAEVVRIIFEKSSKKLGGKLMIFKRSNLADGCTLTGQYYNSFPSFFNVCIAEQGFLHDIRFYATKLTMLLCNHNVIANVQLRVLDVGWLAL